MLKCSQMFSDSMVLQREKCITVWGTGEDGKLITAAIGDNRAECTVKDGKWRCELSPMKAAEDLTLTVSDGTDTLTFKDIAVGEVWFLGGQSNMELEIQNAKDGASYLAELDKDTPIRYYYTPKVASAEAAEEQSKNAVWSRAGSEASKCWSAVGLHFARKLSKELGVVVGLIGCNWGGTSASCWLDRASLENDKRISAYIEEYEETIKGKTLEEQKAEYEGFLEHEKDWLAKAQEYWKDDPDMSWGQLEEKIGVYGWPGPKNEFNPFRPCNMFENMVMRVCPYTIRGFLYYQGESDDHKPDSYYVLLTTLIAKWREVWGDDTLPFIMVQLPMHRYAADPDYKHWCKIRSAQMKAFRTIKNTGIAVILDKGEFNEIHPKDKLPVGERLCLQAEKLVYGMDVDAFGPIFESCVFKDGKAEVKFSNAEKGFEVKGCIKGFEIAGEDGVFHPADVALGGGKAIVASEKVPAPKAVRYNWTNYGEVTVFGKNGLPMAPFSTSDNI
ncbi:sialate O-acetylesterase [Ruminococcus sp.]|uniref:sialate O-acetylesterase n=1 Tax=Ruminococcus sp. TaxID=41978 RepID=UPI0025842BBF|nr:sialate O-acetylesterase [Ruminococcus sp.]MCR5021514.1 sialate O-acetylesterase [Ruminococcus sp.]